MADPKIEVQEGMDAETLAWIEEEQQKAKLVKAKIESGEIPRSAVAGWDSENWQQKAATPAPEDVNT